MKKMGNRGFALMETLLLIFVFLILLASMFSAAGFRNCAELIRIKKLEASYAASAVVDLMIEEILKDGTCSLVDGIDRMETELIFEPDDGSETLRIPVMIWTERKDRELHLFAEVVIGKISKTSSAELYFDTEIHMATDSTPIRASSSTAESGTWIIIEKHGASI